MLNIDNHDKEILEVGYNSKTIQTQDKRDQLNLMDIQYMLQTNNHLLLSYMAKCYIWIEETNERNNKIPIGYMVNPNLSVNKSFKE